MTLRARPIGVIPSEAEPRGEAQSRDLKATHKNGYSFLLIKAPALTASRLSVLGSPARGAGAKRLKG